MSVILTKVWSFIAPYLFGYLKDLAIQWYKTYQLKKEIEHEAKKVNDIVAQIYALEKELELEPDHAISVQIVADIKELENELRKASRDLASDAIL